MRWTRIVLMGLLPGASAWGQLPAGPGQMPAGEELIDQREGHVLTPGRVEPTPERIAQLHLPEGFAINIFASDLGAPRMMAAGPDGTVYVTRREPGDVLAMKDVDADGKADQVRAVVEELRHVHGIAIHDNQMYLATVNAVYVAPMEGGTVGVPRRIIDNLPPGGRHPNRTLAVGPDTKLYITVGSTCNACIEPHPWSATILRSDLDGSSVEIYAQGLRNTLGIGWHPETGEMWGMDNGTDWMGDQEPPEELNLLKAGQHYGWPFVYGSSNDLIDLQTYPEDFDPAAWVRRATPSVLDYTAHTAPLQLSFYTAEQFPQEYRNDAYVAMHGSWNRRPPMGYEIVQVRFNEAGQPQKITPFVRGFLLQMNSDWSWFGRPAGVTVDSAGNLLFSDDANGVIYRVSYSRPSSQRDTD